MSHANMPKLTFQPDLSEHCKRRAIPSVFLEEHARDSASRTMLFSKSELPYSCFIIVKTESANDLLLVIQSVTLADLEQSCVKHSDQLLVFEMGETFGGYWGPLLRSNFDFDKTTERHTVYYTLKTTQEPTEETQGPQSEEEEYDATEPPVSEDSIEQIDENVQDTGVKHMIVEEIPLVEFSGRAIPADKLWTPLSATSEDPFDFDIAPVKGKKYVTHVIPVVEIQMDKNSEKAREQYFNLDYELESIPRIKPKKYPAIFNRGRHTMPPRLFKNKLMTLLDEPTEYDYQNKGPVGSTASTTPTQSYEHLMELVNRLESTTSELVTNVSENTNIKSEDEDDAYSSAEYTERDVLSSLSTSQKRSTQIDNSESDARKSDSTSKTSSTILSINPKPVTDKMMSEKTEAKIDTIISTYSTLSTRENNKENSQPGLPKETGKDKITVVHNSGATVGHQSWENVVQAAPDIASKLNHSTANVFESNIDNNITLKPKSIKKRHIQAVYIENAKPHTFSTVSARATSFEGMVLDAANSYELVKYVELGEDEIHGRAQLRYLRPYVGPIKYNICESIEEPKQQPQKVHLFNSSRIVIAINNFTLKSMTLIVSTVRLVPSSVQHCPASHLECQVSGARVCVDSCVACDGVPNCGSYDTYDEDRHHCGGAPLPYNVYLAAFTFLAVLCTLIYIIHYWIKRCVPKVSDAFFVYTDGAENVLYLETIMRSPNDTDDNKPYHGHIFDDDLPHYLLQHTERKSFFKKFLTKLSFLSRSKSRQSSATVTEPEPEPQERPRMYSFQELEIRKMMTRDTIDESIQTGPSLELGQLPRAASKTPAHVQHSESEESMAFVKMMSPNHNQELNMLKLLQRERPPPGLITPRPSEIRLDLHPGSPRRSAGTDEEELQTTFYVPHGVHEHTKDTMTYESMDSYERRVCEQPSTSNAQHARKRLRFEEGATAIPSASQDPLADDEEARKIYPKKQEDKHETEVREAGPKDFMWFWTGSKNKKLKKKLSKTTKP